MGLNKQKKQKGWCSAEDVVPITSKGKVRCSKCNKRLAPRMIMGKDGQLKGLQLPPHKEK